MVKVLGAAVVAAVWLAAMPGSAQTASPPTSAPPAQAAPATPPVMSDAARSLIQGSTYPMSFRDGRLAGAGFERLMAEAATAQFVLIGEDHNDFDTPRLVTALFRALHQAHGFDYYALEEDPLAMERMSAEPLRGDFARISAWAAARPYGVTFSTDEELRAIAEIGAASTGRWAPIWGAEQAFSVSDYLIELKPLAPDAAAAALVDALLVEAQAEEGAPRALQDRHFISHHAVELLPRLEAIRAAYRPRPGSRSEQLLADLTRSVEIYSFYARSAGGEADIGLSNNTARETELRRQFLHNYRHAEAADGRPPRVLLKYGTWHMYHGRSPGDAFNLGNFLSESALGRDMKALGIATVPFSRDDDTRPDRSIAFAALPGWMRALALYQAPDGWMLVDTRPLRARWHDGTGAFALAPADRLPFRELIFGFDYVLFMPGGRRSPRTVVQGE